MRLLQFVHEFQLPIAIHVCQLIDGLCLPAAACSGWTTCGCWACRRRRAPTTEHYSMRAFSDFPSSCCLSSFHALWLPITLLLFQLCTTIASCLRHLFHRAALPCCCKMTNPPAQCEYPCTFFW